MGAFSLFAFLASPFPGALSLPVPPLSPAPSRPWSQHKAPTGNPPSHLQGSKSHSTVTVVMTLEARHCDDLEPEVQMVETLPPQMKTNHTYHHTQ